MSASLLTLLVAGQLSCTSEPLPTEASDTELWVSFVELGLFETRSDYRLEGDEVRSRKLPESDPFTERESRAEESARSFMDRWQGPAVVSGVVSGTFVREFSVTAERLGVSSNGEYAVTRGINGGLGPLLELPDRVHSLPRTEEVEYKHPVRWDPESNVLVVSAVSVQRSHGPPNEIVLIDVAELHILRRIHLGESVFVEDIAWSPDGDELALLTKVYRPDSGAMKWISDVVYGGGHGRSVKDLTLEIHSIDDGQPRLIPVKEEVKSATDEGVVWSRHPHTR